MKNAKWLLILLLVTLFWGASFPIAKGNLATFGTFAQMSMRFLLGGAVIAAYIIFSRRKIAIEDAKRGAILGTFLFLGYGSQTLGLNYTSATNSAFIGSLFVIIVPIMAAVYLRKMPERKVWLAAIIALAGLWLLTGAGASWNIGDAITLLTALGFSLDIIYTAKIAKECDAISVACVHLFTCGGLSAAFMLALGQVPASYPADGLGAIVFLGVFATGFALWAQISAQKFIGPSRIALIFVLEPVFAMLTAIAFFGEGVAVAQVAGAIMILAGMIIAEYDGIAL